MLKMKDPLASKSHNRGRNFDEGVNFFQPLSLKRDRGLLAHINGGEVRPVNEDDCCLYSRFVTETRTLAVMKSYR